MGTIREGIDVAAMRASLVFCVHIALFFVASVAHAEDTSRFRFFGRRWGSSPSPPSPPAPTAAPIPTAAPTTATLLVGDSSATWSTGITYATVAAALGDTVVFEYSASHDVYHMASSTAYDSCDFTGATMLASASQGGGSGSYPNSYSYTCSTTGNVYVACSVGSHCSAGQKVQIACNTQTNSASTLALSSWGILLCLGLGLLLALL